MLYQLMYSSQSTFAPSMDAMALLLDRARRQNAARGVTGVLFSVDGVFVQILEGERDVVRRLVEHIGQDPRHDGLTVVMERPIAQRVFTSWSMAWISPDASEVAAWARLDGTTRIQEVLASLQQNPARLPAVMAHIVAAIGDSEGNAGEV